MVSSKSSLVVSSSKTHAHASICSDKQLAQQYSSADTVVDDVVLKIDAALSIANQLGAGGESLSTIGEQAKARLTLMGSNRA